jgi:predicted nucleic acid-binding protein
MAGAGILRIVSISHGLRDEAWKVFEQFNRDKQWSFTDCTSYAVMRQLAIGEAFAFDHHFEQMNLLRKP